MPLNVNSQQTHTVTFDNLFQGVNQPGNKFEDKSLRLLHKGTVPTGGENLQVQIHTKTSRTGNKADRALKRQEALTLVKDSIKNQFGGNAAVADRIMGRVNLQKNDRVNLGELRSLKQEVDKETKMRQNLQVLVSQILSGTPNEATMKQALKELEGEFTKPVDVKDKLTEMDWKSLRSVAVVLQQCAQGGETARKATIDTLDQQITALKDKTKPLVNAQGDAKLAKTAEVVSLSLAGRLAEIKQDIEVMRFNSEHGADVDTKAQNWTTLAARQTAHIPSTQEQAQFQREKMSDIAKVPVQQSKIAGEGSGGAILTRSPQLAGGGAVIKLESAKAIAASIATAAYFGEIATGLKQAGKAVPFEAMSARPLDISTQKEASALTGRLKEMQALPTTDAQSQGKIQDHLDNLADPTMGVAPMRCGYIANGSNLNRLDLLDRVALCKTDFLPRDLGRVMVLGRLLGLDDHVGIHGSKFTGGKTNLSNLMMNKDTAKLVLIDYAHVTANRPNGASGFTGADIKASLQSLVDLATNKMTAAELDATLGKILNGKSPIGDLMAAVFETSFDGMFHKDEDTAVASLTTNDRNRFAVNAMLGAIEELESIASNPQVFLRGQPMFDNPQTVIRDIAQLAQNLGPVKADLQNYLRTH